MRTKIKYTWETFQSDCEKIVEEIKDFDYDVIVGITRGGTIFATMISEITGNKKLYLVGYNSYSDQERSELVQTTNIHQDLKDKKILLCDDISDSGKTLIRAKEDLEKLGNEVIIITLHINPDTNLMPSFSLYQTKDWIDYPWDYAN